MLNLQYITKIQELSEPEESEWIINRFSAIPTIGFSAKAVNQTKFNWKSVTGLFKWNNSRVGSPVPQTEAGEYAHPN